MRSADSGARQRGQILAMFALSLVVFLGLAALVIDFGSWLSFRRTYQNVTDAAALAGAPYLTRPLTDACGTTTKEFCARREAWRYLNDSLGLGLDAATLDQYAAANTLQDAPVMAPAPDGGEPYGIWVDTPPGAAGTAYTGFYPADQRKIWARVDRVRDGFFSRVFCVISSCITDRTVTGWATAGAFPNAWAVMTLRRPNQAPGSIGQDITLAGTNTGLEVIAGDVGGNWNMKLNSGNQLWIHGKTDNEADVYLNVWQSCGPSCWDPSQVNSGPNGNPPNVIKPPLPLPGFLEDPNYPLPTGVDPTGKANPPQLPKGISNGIIDVSNTAPGKTIANGNNPLKCDPASPRIGPGYYTSITVRSGKCLILDPIYNWTDWNTPGNPGGPGNGKGKGKGGGGGGGGGSGQIPSAVPSTQDAGIFYVDGPIDVNQNAMIVGDGVTVVMRPSPGGGGSQSELNVTAGGVVSLNLGETPAPSAPNQQFVADCISTSCRLGAWMTSGSSPYVWDNPRHRWSYDSGLNGNDANVGVALYVIKRSQYAIVAADDNSDVVTLHAGAALVWSGVTYAPHDNVVLAGQPGHQGIGQLVCWTLTFVGGTTVQQTFTGPETSVPRLFEPTIPTSP